MNTNNDGGLTSMARTLREIVEGRTVGVVYAGRMGDIVGMLMVAEELDRNGAIVTMYSQMQYTGILLNAPYVRISYTCESADHIANDTPRLQKAAHKECDYVYDVQVSPFRHKEFDASGMTWREWICSGRLIDTKTKKSVEHEDIISKDKADIVMPLLNFSEIEFARARNLIGPKALLVHPHAHSDGGKVRWKWLAPIITSLVNELGLDTVAFNCGDQTEWAMVEKKYLSRKPTGLNAITKIINPPQFILPAVMAVAKAAILRNSGLAWIASSKLYCGIQHMGQPWSIHIPLVKENERLRTRGYNFIHLDRSASPEWSAKAVDLLMLRYDRCHRYYPAS
jgi:hypothetical protein